MVDVRPIGPDDAPALHAVLDQVARERRYLSMVEAPPLERVQAFVRANLQRGAPHFLAWDGDRAVGWCDAVPLTAPGRGHSARLALGVARSYRRQGVGRRLLEATLVSAAARGLSRIELEVWASNLAAIALYERCGFEHEGRKRRARFLDGVWEDLLLMARLREAGDAAT